MYTFASKENKEKLRNALKKNVYSVQGIGTIISERIDETNWLLTIQEEGSSYQSSKQGDVWEIQINKDELVHIDKKERYYTLTNGILLIFACILGVTEIEYIAREIETLGLIDTFLKMCSNLGDVLLSLLFVACVLSLITRIMARKQACKLINAWFDEIGISEEKIYEKLPVVKNTTRENIFVTQDKDKVTYMCMAILDAEKEAVTNQYANKGVILSNDDFDRFIDIDLDTKKLLFEKYTEYKIIDAQTQSVLYVTRDEAARTDEVHNMFFRIKSSGGLIKYEIEPAKGDEPEFVNYPYYCTAETLVYEFDLATTNMTIEEDFITLESDNVHVYRELDKCCTDNGREEEGYQYIIEKIPNIYVRRGNIGLAADLKHY